MTADLSNTELATKADTSTGSKQGSQSFSSASLSIRAQKKVASKLSNRSLTKLFIPDAANRLLDHLLLILVENYSKKDSEKVVKNIIKLSVKMGLLAMNNLLNEEAKQQLDTVQEQVHALSLTVISFAKVDYSYDRTYFFDQLRAVQKTLAPLVVLHLSDKSSKRLEHIFQHLINNHLADTLFKANGPQKKLLNDLVAEMEQLVETEDI